MLVVVFIIGILVSTLIPRLVNAQERTKDVIIKKDLKDLQLALETYYADGGTFVLSAQDFKANDIDDYHRKTVHTQYLS